MVLAAIVVLILAVPSALGFGLAAALDSGGDGADVTRVATLGVMAPLSGDLSPDGTSVRNAVALAVDEANDDGAIPGWRLELSTRDDGSRPDGGAQAADAFAANDRLIGVVGPVNSLVAQVALPTLAEAGIPVVSPSTADPALTGVGGHPRTRPYPTFFRLSGTDELQAQVAANYAVRTLGRHRIAVVDGEPRYGTTLGDRFAVRAAALGASVTTMYPMAGDGGDGTDLDGVVTALEQESPDLVYVTTGASFAGKLRSRLADAGVSIQVLGSDGLLEPRYTDEARAAADGDLITSLLTPATRLPAAGAFVVAYSARFGGPADDEGATTSPEDATPSRSATPSHGPSPSHTATPSRGTTHPRPAARDVSAGSGHPAIAPAVPGPRTDRPATEDGDGDGDGPASARARQAAHDAAEELTLRQAEAIPAVATYAYDAARAIIRAAAAVLPGRQVVDAGARRHIAAAVGRGSFAGVTGTVAFDQWGDARRPSVALYTVLGGRFVALTTRTS